MSTRLDRLFALLESGSNCGTRRAAALQLGEVQKLHPHELKTLLNRLLLLLRSSSWDTRVAAGQAVAAVAESVPEWTPAATLIKSESSDTVDIAPGRMCFVDFDIENVIRNGAQLLGSEGKEYDWDDTTDSQDVSAKRALLNQHMGLDGVADRAGLTAFATDMIREEDLRLGPSVSGNSCSPAPVPLSSIWSSCSSSMSARERNRLKRKFKSSLSRTISADNDHLEPETSDQSSSKKSRVMDEQIDGDDVKSELGEDSGCCAEDASEWPFARLLDDLCGDLFHSDWRTRHGAATGIREVIRVHGSGCGKSSQLTEQNMLSANQRWLEDVALRLLCVLALDRFGDFVSYEVVAPVRETCAQALGAVVRWMVLPQLIDDVVDCLLKLVQQSNWQARHGGLLGIKYVLVVKQHLVSDLFPKVYPMVVGSLKDSVDDVCAVAAASLEAVMDEFLRVMPKEVPKVLALLWDGLLEFDDLTSWTNSFMSLLSTIVAKCDPQEFSATQKPLNELLPRLWPFLEHSSEQIRISVLQTIDALVRTAAGATWLPQTLPDLIKRLFRRCLLEERVTVHHSLLTLWATCLARTPTMVLEEILLSFASTWMCLAMQPAHLPIDFGLFPVLASDVAPRGTTLREKQLFLAGSESLNEGALSRDTAVIRTRLLAARMFAALAGRVLLAEDGRDLPLTVATLNTLTEFYLKSKSAMQKFEASLVVLALSQEDHVCQIALMQSVFVEMTLVRLIGCLEETMPYDELALSITGMHTACVALVQDLLASGVTLEPVFSRPVLTLEQCQLLVTSVSEKAMMEKAAPAFNRKGSLKLVLLQKRNEAAAATQTASAEFLRLSTRVRLSAAVALIGLQYTPEKLGPLVRPLMDTLKREENTILQELAAESLAILVMRICDTSQATCDKILKNLCSYLCCDPWQTPRVDDPLAAFCQGNLSDEEDCDLTKTNGILSLFISAKEKERQNGQSRSSGCGRGKVAASASSPVSCSGSSSATVSPEDSSSLEVQRVGGECGLRAICLKFGADVTAKLPQLIAERILAPLGVLASGQQKEMTGQQAQEAIFAMQILDKLIGALHSDTHQLFFAVLPNILTAVSSGLTAVRHVAARLIASITAVNEERMMQFVVEEVVKLLECGESVVKRQGAIEAIGCVLERLGVGIIPYVVLLTVPVMRRMTDQDQNVRLMASQCFGSLVRLMPLGMAAAAQNKPKPGQWVVHKPDEMRFLEQLLDSRKMEAFIMPLPVSAQLRSYQQDGLNWLSFLNRYNLHGILCDDMGLGKTLQTICILAADHLHCRKHFEETKSSSFAALPSLVICPSTLIGHWAQEVGKFVEKEYLNPIQYEGTPAERQKLRRRVKNYSLVISSYEIVKNDVDFFKDTKWNYCVLDEGHVIRNNKTRVFKAIKQLICKHRLILSGTPVQNNVQDLWALFDFLMPGLLGTEKKFSSRFARPIDASKDPKATSRDIEEGALAMEALHKQVLPFILRRLKSDVLKDLPPKIIQDYYCDLSPLQLRLYEDFAKSKAQKDVVHSILSTNSSVTSGTSGHVFQAFQYLRKVCNHPALVLNEKHPQYKEVARELEMNNSSLFDIQHAAKFLALQQLLLDCGIGQEGIEQSVVNSHRALIFCQLTAVLEMLEQHLFRAHMPSVTYLKLDGSVPVRDRQAIVDRFNSDPSIDVLLLTTSIGGLGLNLTGADTVIFVEHDWNPSKDIQAMDRAHRIGQKRVVNVYRLITRGTLEEKIMGLQKFKLHVANSIITQENSGLQTMDTEQIVDLFSVDTPASRHPSSNNSAKKSNPKVPVKGLKAALDNLENLWDSSQYDTEYDVNRFMDSLKRS